MQASQEEQPWVTFAKKFQISEAYGLEHRPWRSGHQVISFDRTNRYSIECLL